MVADKFWYVRAWHKSGTESAGGGLVEASSPEEAAEILNGGPVRFFYEADDHWEYVGKYLYVVRKL